MIAVSPWRRITTNLLVDTWWVSVSCYCITVNFLSIVSLCCIVLQDELLWAAAWLYQATDENYYLDYLANNADEFGGTGWAITEFGWDVKFAGVQVLASKVLIVLELIAATFIVFHLC